MSGNQIRKRVPPWLNLAAFAFAALLATGVSLPAQDEASSSPSSSQSPNRGIRMIAPLPDGEWRLPNGDLASTRYSPLAQITVANAGQLRMITSLSTRLSHGHEG